MIKTIFNRACHRSGQPHRYSRHGIHLLHAMFTQAGRESLAKIRNVDLPLATCTSLNLFDGKGKDLGTMTLSQALKHIKPGSHLTRLGSMSGRYEIKSLSVSEATAPLPGSNTDPLKFKRAGRSKEFRLMPDSSAGFMKGMVLRKAYQFLLRGARIEIQLRDPKHKEFTLSAIRSILDENLHLRPDSILAAMPEGTTMLAEPCTLAITGHSSLMWAMEHPASLELARVSTPKYIKRWGFSKRVEADYATLWKEAAVPFHS